MGSNEKGNRTGGISSCLNEPFRARQSLKLLLLQPPVEDFYDTPVRLQPIGLAYLKAAVLAHLPHCRVKIVDLHHGWGRFTVKLPADLDDLRAFYPCADKSPFSVFHNYYHFGADWDAVAAVVRLEAPDVVGISCLFSAYFREALKTAEVVKKTLNVPLVMGGSHVSAMPEGILKSEFVDYVVCGEGERPLVQLLKLLNSGEASVERLQRIEGLGFKVAGEPKLNPPGENFPLEEIPLPDLEDFPGESYQYAGKKLALLVTSRSCPHRCSFCSVHTTFGQVYRWRSVESVLDELKTRFDQGYRVIDFEDDNLTFRLEEMKILCRRIAKEFPPGELQLLAMNGISYLSLDQELLRLMREAGFTHLNLSLVSSDTSVLAATKRPHSVEKFRQVVQEAWTMGFKIVAYQILGLPFESLESMVQTLLFLSRLPVLIGASPFYLAPGSALAERMNPHMTEPDLLRSRLTALEGHSEKIEREELFTLFVTTRIINFVKGLNVPAGVEAWLENDCSLRPPLSDVGRTNSGLRILKLLLEQNVLFADTRNGLVPVDKFRSELFAEVWAQVGEIATVSGGRIRLGEPNRGSQSQGIPLDRGSTFDRGAPDRTGNR